MPYALEILRLEICFAILIPWPEKEQIHAGAGNQKSKELQRAWSGENCFIRFHDGFFISGFPVLDGVAIWVSLLRSRAPSSSSQGVGLVSRGEDIHQAAKEGNVGAVRHFLRVDPESLERGDNLPRRSLGAEAGNFGEDE